MNVEIFKMANKTDSNSGVVGGNFAFYLYLCALSAENVSDQGSPQLAVLL